jgi:hypothetical protein
VGERKGRGKGEEGERKGMERKRKEGVRGKEGERTEEEGHTDVQNLTAIGSVRGASRTLEFVDIHSDVPIYIISIGN